MVLERALVDVAYNEGLVIQRAHQDQPILDALERSIGTFNMRVTDNPRHLGDTVAAYARDLEPEQWRYAEKVRDALGEAIARDGTTDAQWSTMVVE